MLPNTLVTGPQDAPALVLINSLGSDLSMWEPQVGPLAEHLRLVRFDARGHGGTAAPDGPYSIADLAGDVVDVLDGLDVRRASVCGISLGGMVAIWLGVNAADRIERLVLSCTAAHLPPVSNWTERAAAVRAAGSPAPLADTVVGRWLTPEHAAADPGLRERLRAMIAGTDGEAYALCCEAIGGFDERASLTSISAPTLVIGGDCDPSIPNEHQRELAAAIPGARLEILSPAAHLANLDLPARFNALVVEHLSVSANA